MLGITSESDLFSHDNLPKNISIEWTECPEASSSLRKPTILVVDDQQMIADTTTIILNPNLVFAPSAHIAAGLPWSWRFLLKPDYLLTDIAIPGMNGVDLAVSVRHHLPATIIVLISGQAGITDLLQQAKQDGHEFDLLAKPIHPENLLGYIREMPRISGDRIKIGSQPVIWRRGESMIERRRFEYRH